MAHKVALINMKGGVGKSTLAANLAWSMATPPWDKKVLVVDLDPQFNCSQYLLGALRMDMILAENEPTVWNILEQLTSVPGREREVIDPVDAVVGVYSPRRLRGSIDLVPSRLEVAQSLRQPAGKAELIVQAIRQLQPEYDLIIIDCPPTESMLTSAAYLAADYLLIPVRPEFLSAVGLPLLEQSLEDFEALHGSDQVPAVLGIVFNAMSDYAPEEVVSRRQVRQVARVNEWPVFDEDVGYSRSFPKSAREGRPVFLTSYVRSTTKRNFRKVAEEFAGRVGI